MGVAVGVILGVTVLQAVNYTWSIVAVESSMAACDDDGEI